jgi:hypothetical protein
VVVGVVVAAVVVVAAEEAGVGRAGVAVVLTRGLLLRCSLSAQRWRLAYR